MPRISDEIADCTFYLYHSIEAARSGSLAGGSGFLVHLQSAVPGYGHFYAVTNDHLIRDGCCVLRLNRKNGGIDALKTDAGDWVKHRAGDDIAVCPIRIDETFQWRSVGIESFIDKQTIEAYNVGYGDEVFLAGRLVAHSGRQRNAIVVRFGNISLMADADELIDCGAWGQHEGFLVECRSLSGFSGSPVFVMTTQDYKYIPQHRLRELRQEQTIGIPGEIISRSGTFGPWLLGIDWGHMPLWKPVFEADKNTRTKQVVEQNTGIACVSPAWKILEVLSVEDLVKARHEEDQRIAERLKT